MAYYLKGIGDEALRINEILPSFDARINKFIIGHTAGIISGEFNNFYASAIDRGVVVQGGMMQAYGFFGMSDSNTQINFLMPSTTSYIHIYAEIDLSVVPNNFEIKSTAMSNSSAYTFRQENLFNVPNGKYQFPLWMVTLTASTIMLSDRRAYITKPADAVTAENYTTSGGIASKFSTQETDYTSKYNSAIATANSKLPKMTLVLSNKSYTITTAGVGSQTYTLNSGTTVSSGDLLFVNGRVTNFGNRTICGLVRMQTSVIGWVTITMGGNGMPYSCIDTLGISITLGSSTSQLTCGGYCRTRIRGDSYDSSGHNISLANADYTIDSIYKINL